MLCAQASQTCTFHAPLTTKTGCLTQIQTPHDSIPRQALIDAVTAAIPPPPLPPLPPSLYIPPPVDLPTARPDQRFEERLWICQHDRCRREATGLEMVGYGIRIRWVDLAGVIPEIATYYRRKVDLAYHRRSLNGPRHRVDLLMGDRDDSPGERRTPDTATPAEYSHQTQQRPYVEDSLSHQRYEARDERHRLIVSTARAAEEARPKARDL
ncbi:hypothetical protein Tco_0687392 [Tanacetum coccineum]